MKKFIVFFAAIAMVGAFAFSAVAADWSFYGSARMSTFSAERSKEITGTGFDDTDTTWDLQSNARLGANVAAGDVTGRFELGLNDENPSTTAAFDGVYTRIIWGEWNFGGGKLGIGKHYTPLTVLYSNQVFGNDADLLAWGAIYFGRRPMVQLTFGGFKVALVEPITTGVTTTGAGVVDTDTTIPMIMAKYKFKTDAFFVEGFGGYATHEQVVAADSGFDIDSYLLGVGAGANFGAFYIKGDIYIGENVASLGSSETGTTDQAVYNSTTGNFDDAETLGYIAVVGFKASDTLTFEAGYGATKHEIDQSGLKTEDESNAYYINATYTLAPGVFIVPEFGKQDLDDIKVGGMSTPQGDTTYFGLKWQINF